MYSIIVLYEYSRCILDLTQGTDNGVIHLAVQLSGQKAILANNKKTTGIRQVTVQ